MASHYKAGRYLYWQYLLSLVTPCPALDVRYMPCLVLPIHDKAGHEPSQYGQALSCHYKACWFVALAELDLQVWSVLFEGCEI